MYAMFAVVYICCRGRAVTNVVRTCSPTPLLKRQLNMLKLCICENKDADELRGDREADQRLCFRYTDSTIPLLPRYEITSL